MARSRSRNPGSRARAGLSSSSPASAARSATGLTDGLRPRPAGASGRVITAATLCRDRSSASSEGTAARGVPANTTRMSQPVSALVGLAAGRVRRHLHLLERVAPPFGLADRLHGELALLGIEPVDEQHAVQVVGLVLHAA